MGDPWASKKPHPLLNDKWPCSDVDGWDGTMRHDGPMDAAVTPAGTDSGRDTEVKHGVCNLCEAICGLKITLTDGLITDIRGDQDDPLSRGHICPKGVALADLHNDPDRLRLPIRRVGEAWQEMEWDDAIEWVATRLAETQRQHGRNAVGVYLGNPNAHSLGSMTHGLALVKALRTKNLFSASSVDQLPHQLVSHLMFGHQLLIPVPDLDRTDHLIVVGGNPMASNGSLMTAPGFGRRIRELHGRGGRLIVLDPRRTETAEIADEHHFVRPGSDVFVLLAMARSLIASDTAFWPDYIADAEQTRTAIAAALDPFTVSRAAQVSGVAAETIERLTAEYAAAPRAAVYARLGVSANTHGTLGIWAVNLINLLSGNLDREGGSLFTTPLIDITGTVPPSRAGLLGRVAGKQGASRGLVGPGHHGLWHSRVRGLPETANEFPSAALAEEIDTPGDGQIKALLTIAGNPVLSTPDGGRLDRALAGIEFMAAIDFYVNETTRHADVILPPATHLERDHYDLVFHALAVRNTARFSPAVLTPPSHARQDWQIFSALATRYAGHAGWTRRRRVQLAARLAPSPTRILDLLLRRSGSSVRKLSARPSGLDLGPLQAHQLPQRLRNGRLEAFPRLIAEALTALTDPVPLADDELRLIGRRHLRDCNSWMHNSPRLIKGRSRSDLLMHPDDLSQRGLSDGDPVEVRSRVGVVGTTVRASDALMPGVVSLPHGYGHQRQGVRLRVAGELAGISINDLTDPESLDVSGNAALNGVPVRVTLTPNA